MNFFEHQDRARGKTTRLLLLFAVMVAAIVLIIYTVVALGLQQGAAHEAAGLPRPGWWNGELFLWVAMATLGVILGGATIKTMGLRGGGGKVAEAMGGRLVARQSRDPKERQLVNVVEEMAIASGIPVPLTFVMDNEPGINAFAAGYRPEDAAVAVTRGALDQFSRDELQGVIAHEFSHIINGDMRLNIRLMGLLGGILAMATIGRIIMHSSSHSRRRDGQGAFFAGLALLIVGYIGVIAGRIIQAALSRQREYLADASAVQFTRNPAGIAGALRRIAAAAHGSQVANAAAAEASHMFFGPIRLSSLLATHPPLEERIRRVEEGGPPGELRQAAGRAATDRQARPKAGRQSFDAESVAGIAAMAGVSAAQERLGAVPKLLQEAIGSGLGAEATVLALLLDEEPGAHRRQLDLLRERAPEALMRELQLLEPAVRKLPRRLRLPLADMAVPALRQMTRKQAGDFIEVLRSLILADNQVTLFEFALFVVVTRRLGGLSGARLGGAGPARPQSLGDAQSALLAILCQAGAASPEGAARAWQAARVFLPELPDAATGFGRKVAVAELLEALAALAQGPQRLRRRLLTGVMAAVQADRKVTVEEAELVRAVAAALDLPQPLNSELAE